MLSNLTKLKLQSLMALSSRCCSFCGGSQVRASSKALCCVRGPFFVYFDSLCPSQVVIGPIVLNKYYKQRIKCLAHGHNTDTTQSTALVVRL